MKTNQAKVLEERFWNTVATCYEVVGTVSNPYSCNRQTPFAVIKKAPGEMKTFCGAFKLKRDAIKHCKELFFAAMHNAKSGKPLPAAVGKLDANPLRLPWRAFGGMVDGYGVVNSEGHTQIAAETLNRAQVDAILNGVNHRADLLAALENFIATEAGMPTTYRMPLAAEQARAAIAAGVGKFAALNESMTATEQGAA
jgi:hypothetical protein